MTKKIKITCKGSRSVPIDRLFDFQGNLKTLERDDADKLKRSILKHGFSFPVMVWGEKILDGHQRLFVTRELIKDGYVIADIPVVDIQATTEAEAAEKLLLINSHYAKITDEGLYEFLNEHSVDIIGISDILNFDDIDLNQFQDVAEITELIEEDEYESKKRNLGERKYQIKPVLYSDSIVFFEQAIKKTGNMNYANALIDICKYYLDHAK